MSAMPLPSRVAQAGWVMQHSLMNVLFTLFLTLVPLFTLIVTGYGLRRWTQVLHLRHVPVLNALVLQVTLPATVFLALSRTPSLPAAVFRLPLLLLAAEFGCMALAFFVCRAFRLPRATQGMVMLTSAFGNTAFLGYPVVLAVMPRLFAPAVLLDEFGMMVPMYICASLVTGAFGLPDESGHVLSWKASVLQFARSPVFVALVAGIAAYFLRAAVPAALHVPAKLGVQTLGYLAAATTPLVLLALGMALRPRAATSPVLILPCVMKLVLCPLLMWGICRVLAEPPDITRICVLQASMPTGVVVSLLCGQYELDGAAAGGTVFVSTVCSLLTIPIFQALLR